MRLYVGIIFVHTLTLVIAYQDTEAIHTSHDFSNIQENLPNKVAGIENDLRRESIALEDVTERYIMAKLREKLFKKLRLLLQSDSRRKSANQPHQGHPRLNSASFRRQPRQSDEDEDGEEEEVSAGNSTTTTARPINIIPQVANLVKAIFGGNSINVTSYAQAATKYLPPSVGNQLLGVVKLLAHNPSARWTTTTTTTTVAPPPKQATSPISLILLKPKNSTSGNKEAGKNVSKTNSAAISGIGATTNPTIILIPAAPALSTAKSAVSTVKVKGTTKEDDEDEEEEDNFRQLRLPDFSDGINGLTALFGGRASRRPVNATTESASGFEEETTASSNGGLDLREVASGLRLGLGDLIKVMPDLFKGAREAVGLLSGIQSLLGSFGG